MTDSPARPQVDEPRIRRGLVLEGGGAKGAWQFGALLALYDAGIEFDWVAGTSVGALNGALWSSGRLDLGQELWGAMSRSKVFRLRGLYSPLILAGAIPRIFNAHVNGLIPRNIAPGISWVTRALNAFMSIPMVVSGLYLGLVAIGLFNGLFFVMPRFILIPILLICVWFGLSILFEYVANVLLFKGTFFVSSIGALLGILMHLYSYVFGSPMGDQTPPFVVRAALDIPLVLLVLALMPLATFWFGNLLQTRNLSIFETSPLETLVNDLAAGGFKVPMFVTVAREIYGYYDPDDLRLRYNRRTNRSTAISRSAIIPIYLRVDKLSQKEAVNTLLGTSALPLGITPRVHATYNFDPNETPFGWEAAETGTTTQDVFLMDGGVVDNLPWHPLVDETPCDQIVIVACSPCSSWDDEKMRLEWKRLNRLRRVIRFREDVRNDSFGHLMTNSFREQYGRIDYIKNEPPEIIRLNDPKHWPRSVITIAPDTSLGSFLTGTLNFSTQAARDRMDAGYQKACQFIEYADDLESSVRS